MSHGDEAQTVRDLLSAMPVKARNALLFEILGELGASRIVVDSADGAFEGAVADQTVALKFFKNRVWAPEVTEILRRFFTGRTGGTFIDLGANIGLVTVPLARLEAIGCIAVEAHPEIFQMLRLNLLRNGLEGRVELHNEAVFTETGEVAFDCSPVNFGDNRVRRDDRTPDDLYGEDGWQSITVDAGPLDSMIDADRLSSPVAMKMDIQGAEPFVFSHGRAVLERTDLLIMEYWPYGFDRLGTRRDTLHAAIREHFPYGAVLTEDQNVERLALSPINEILAEVESTGGRNRIEAIDILLSKSSASILSR